MKRIGRMLGAALALALLMGMLTGCFPFLQIFKSKDERLLGQAMEQFFAALEERDAETPREKEKEERFCVPLFS